MDLAELISLCAQSRADGRDGDGPAWAATAAVLGRGGLELPAAHCANGAMRGFWMPPPATLRATTPSTARWAHMPDSSGRVAAMLAAFVQLLAAAEKSASEEGRDIVLSMLVVGLIFVASPSAATCSRKLRKKH